MEINGMEANNSAAANNGTAAGASSTHASSEGQGNDTSAGCNESFSLTNSSKPALDFLHFEPIMSSTFDDTQRAPLVNLLLPLVIVVYELSSSLAALAFAAALFIFFLKRRLVEIDGREANNSAAANNGHASTEGQEIDTLAGYDYEVFLSFRGPDTRATFTDFLWTLLEVEGIRAFKDDESLRKGEEFGPKLLKAIDESKILIPIFSKDYASSVWCLKELAQMVKCQEKGTQLIKPIFYDVDPSEVRYQIEGYAKALEVHRQKGRHNEKTMQGWKNALTKVGEINGWNLHSEGKNRREGASAKKIAQEVFNDLKKDYLLVPDCFVDVNDDLRKIKDMIAVETSETRIIGIHGMGGIGKTTLAKKIYNELSNNFEHRCFLANIREMSECRGIEHLQHQLVRTVLKTERPDVKNMEDGIKIIQERFCTKKVLFLLDDVDHKEHMDALVGKGNWFGEGSKLIITTRNKEMLDALEGVIPYKLNGMNDVQSLRLFSKHAFGRDSPSDEYINQSNKAIKIARGLPLALEIIGSLLRHTEKEMWDATLKMLESVPHSEVQSKLKVSYDALDFRQKRIFLDIACLFIGHDKDTLIHYWDESTLFPKEAMKVLQNLSLIKIGENNEVWMHDQLRDLGREIVREKSDTKIEKQSRVWNPKEGLKLLRRCKGKKEVEALRFKLDDQQQYCFTYEDFENLSGLRFLEVDGSMENFCLEDRRLWHESTLHIHAMNENSNLLPHLRWLSWHHIPPTFNITNFFMEDVVFLDLSYSEIRDDWNGWSHMKLMKNLKVLELFNCKNLRSLPDELGQDLASLEYLSLRFCSSLVRLPNTIGNMKSLTELNMTNTRIKELPDFIGELKNLKVVEMLDSLLTKLNDAIWTMEKLEHIEVSGNWDSHAEIGNRIYANKSLRILKLYFDKIYAPPMLPESLTFLELENVPMDKCPDLSNLTNLKRLRLQFVLPDDDDGKCDGLGELPIPPPWIGDLTKVEDMVLIWNTPEGGPRPLPPGEPPFCPTLPSICLQNLSVLSIAYVAITEIQRLVCLETLLYMELRGLPLLERLPDLSNLNKLRSLVVIDCDKLIEFPTELSQSLESPSLPRVYGLISPPDLSQSLRVPRLPSSLFSLRLEGCKSLCSIGDLSNMKNLSSLSVSGAAITEIQGLVCLKNLEDLQLWTLPQLEILPDLSSLSKLRNLKVFNCDNLVEIKGELPRSLDKDNCLINSCPSLRKFPDRSNLRMRKTDVIIESCEKLNVEGQFVEEESESEGGDDEYVEEESESEGGEDEFVEEESESEGGEDEYVEEESESEGGDNE